MVGKLLPQILLGNARTFAKKWMQPAQAEVGGNIVLWRERSAWNNHFLMQRYICLLSRCLADYLETCTVFLVVDMAPCHIHQSVFATARRKGIRMILVPAGLTGILQPLDSHVFRQFRRRLEALWLDSKCAHEDGRVTFLAWMRLLKEAIEAVIVGKDWMSAFQQTGHFSRQSMVWGKLLFALAWTQSPEVAPGLPALGQASGMFPRGWRGNVEAWVHWRPAPLFSPVLTLDWSWKKFGTVGAAPSTLSSDPAFCPQIKASVFGVFSKHGFHAWVGRCFWRTSLPGYWPRRRSCNRPVWALCDTVRLVRLWHFCAGNEVEPEAKQSGPATQKANAQGVGGAIFHHVYHVVFWERLRRSFLKLTSSCCWLRRRRRQRRRRKRTRRRRRRRRRRKRQRVRKRLGKAERFQTAGLLLLLRGSGRAAALELRQGRYSHSFSLLAGAGALLKTVSCHYSPQPGSTCQAGQFYIFPLKLGPVQSDVSKI